MQNLIALASDSRSQRINDAFAKKKIYAFYWDLLHSGLQPGGVQTDIPPKNLEYHVFFSLGVTSSYNQYSSPK